MSPKRLLLISVLALTVAAAAALAIVSDAHAGGIRDWEPCPAAPSQDLICPDGQAGVPYTIKFRAVEEPPCQPGDDFWYVKQGSAPTGLSLGSDGTLSGTPTEAGTWAFWVEMKLPDTPTCNGTTDTTQERFIITIKPGVPKLTIGPESAPVGTVATPYTLQMTATVGDAKTWTISSGALPTGLAIGATDGVISGTPSASGAFTFTVKAEIDPQRTDTKTLTIEVRDALTISAPELSLSEVGVRFVALLTASGGFGTYTWALASGEIPPGFVLGSKGALAGRPAIAGTYNFQISVTDAESRVATYDGEIVVANRLAISTLALRRGKVGRRYQAKLAATGGVTPTTWTLKRGPLPKGVRFNRKLGLLVGTPRKAGSYRVVFEIRDELGVVAKKTLRLAIVPTPKKKKNS